MQILNVVDGCIPSDMSTGTTEEVEEERRLLYVAMTRQRTTCGSWYRSASTSTSRPRPGTATSTLRAAGSFPTR